MCRDSRLTKDERSGVARAPGGAAEPKSMEIMSAVFVADWAVVVSAAEEDTISERTATAVDAVRCMMVDVGVSSS